MTLTPEKAVELLPKISQSVIQRGECEVWIGPKYRGGKTFKGGSRERYPYVGDGNNVYRVRRVVWIAANGEAPPGQRYTANCGTPWCVSLAHTVAHDIRKSLAERTKLRVEQTRLSRERARQRADLRCEDCGRQRTPGSIARCRVCSAKRCSRGPNKAYGITHLKNVHAAREFRKRLIERKGA